jgi:release factor glutamine methyltransferase
VPPAPQPARRRRGTAVVTLGTAFEDAAARLRHAGVTSPDADAAWLIEAVTGLAPSAQRLRARDPLAATAGRRLQRLLTRRAAREPLQLVLRETCFYGLRLVLRPGVLVPRPETEALVAWALTDLPARPSTVIDVGCGSGAAAFAVAAERPQARVLAGDVEPAAVALTRYNARALGLRVAAVRSDLLTHPRLAATARRGALLLANLPYLPASDRGTMSPELEWEPPGALFAGADGLREARRLRAQAWRLLPPGSPVWCELDPRNAAAFARESRATGWRDARLAPDLAGRRRFVRLLR